MISALMNLAGLPVTPQQMQSLGFHVCPIPLRPGSIIEAGNYGRIIRFFGEQHDQYQREQLLERVRREEFPDRPSRLASSFYCPNGEMAERFRFHHSTTGIIYLVVPVDPGAPRHVAYMNCLPPIAGFDDEDIARRYWRADFRVQQQPDNFAPEEVLIASPLMVVQNISALLAASSSSAEVA